MKKPKIHQHISLQKIVGGGQAMGELADGRKAFVWGGLPGEIVDIRETKRKSKYIEGVVTEVVKSSPERIDPAEPDSYLSTSPWQIMSFEAEQRHKAELIDQAFALHKVGLPLKNEIFTDNQQWNYRNKVEFSWYGDIDPDTAQETLNLAFFKRGSKGKVIVDSTQLARHEINQLARQIRDYLRSKKVTARQLKTLLIRCDQAGNCVWQLYVKDDDFQPITTEDGQKFSAQGGEVIYSDPRSPASRITRRLAKFGDITLQDQVLGKKFSYACEGFFQVNLPVYEQALKDMGKWVSDSYDTTSYGDRAAKRLSHPEGSAFPAERGQESGNWRPRAPEGGDGREGERDKKPDPTNPSETASMETTSFSEGSDGKAECSPSSGAEKASSPPLPKTSAQTQMPPNYRLGPSLSSPSGPVDRQLPYSWSTSAGKAEPSGDDRDDPRLASNSDRATSDSRQASGHSAFSAEVGQDRLVISDRPDARGLMGGDGVRDDNQPKTLDLYSGVGSIGLTIGGDNCTLVEVSQPAVREMRRNIAAQNSSAQAILAASEKALDYITPDTTVIVDPPRAGLHPDVIEKLLEAAPPKIIYLSCNPVTQARDIALLSQKYQITAHRGYNFFPRTPHIEHLVVLIKI